MKHTYSHTLTKASVMACRSTGNTLNYFLLPQEGKKDVWDMVDRLRQVVLIKPLGPGCPMVLCLLSTKMPHRAAPVFKWERSGAVWRFAVRSLEIQRIVWLTGQVTRMLRLPWRVDFKVWELEWWSVRRVCSRKGKLVESWCSHRLINCLCFPPDPGGVSGWCGRV